jgi:hypothetical protein
LWTNQRNHTWFYVCVSEDSWLNKKPRLSSIFSCDQIYKGQGYEFSYNLLCQTVWPENWAKFCLIFGKVAKNAKTSTRKLNVRAQYVCIYFWGLQIWVETAYLVLNCSSKKLPKFRPIWSRWYQTLMLNKATCDICSKSSITTKGIIGVPLTVQ